jgi:hypothetical protein
VNLLSSQKLRPELLSCNSPNGGIQYPIGRLDSEATATVEDILSDSRADFKDKIVQVRGDEGELCWAHVSPIELPLGERTGLQSANILMYSLCHNSVDKPAVREIAQPLSGLAVVWHY